MNKCSIVEDMLSLYVEDMLSDDSKKFIEEHINECSSCRKALKEFEEMKNSEDKTVNYEEIRPLKKVKKKILKKIILTLFAVGAFTAVIGFLFGSYEVPVQSERDLDPDDNTYRLMEFEIDYFKPEEIEILKHKPTEEETEISNIILDKAYKAFTDITRTEEERRIKYGALSRYTIDNECYPEVEKAVAFLDKLTCRIDGDKGYIWVNYSLCGYDRNYKPVTGSYAVNSLWTIEKDENNEWNVTETNEHP